MEEHMYALEIDVIESIGEEGVKRLAEEGNTVYIDFDALERESQNHKNPKLFEP